MATQVRRDTRPATEPAVVMRAVPRTEPAVVCSDCIYHIPHATRPDGWCACAHAELRWHTVSRERVACEDFADWPEGSPVPAFLVAMRF